MREGENRSVVPEPEDKIYVESAASSAGMAVTIQVILEPGAKRDHKMAGRLNAIALELLAEKWRALAQAEAGQEPGS